MRKLLYLLSSIFLLCSCNKDDAPVSVDDGMMNISSCYVVRNNNNLSENFSSPIGLYILAENSTPYNDTSYKNFATLTSGKWQINTPVHVDKKGSVFAYYPYKSGDNPESLAVNMANQVDWLYSKAALSLAPVFSSLSVKLHHALSQATVLVEGEEVTGLSLQSPLTAKFNVRTGVFSSLVSGTVSSSTGQLLILPHMADTNVDLKIRLKSGSEYSYSLSGKEFLAGENNTYQFKLNASRETLEFTSVTVEDWINDNNYNDYL